MKYNLQFRVICSSFLYFREIWDKISLKKYKWETRNTRKISETLSVSWDDNHISDFPICSRFSPCPMRIMSEKRFWPRPTMWPAMVFVLSLLSYQRAWAKPRCGGIYTDARGVIQTPGFPGPFATPIDCEWVIDAQHMLPKNTTIVVYLTQLFVFEGKELGGERVFHPECVNIMKGDLVMRFSVGISKKWVFARFAS